MSREEFADTVDRDEVLRIVDEVQNEILHEDKLGASRNQVAEGTCERIKRRIKEGR